MDRRVEVVKFAVVAIIAATATLSVHIARKVAAQDAATPRVTGDMRLVFEPLPESSTLYIYDADKETVDPETGGLRWCQPAVTISADGRRMIVAAEYSPTGETLVIKFAKPIVLRQ